MGAFEAPTQMPNLQPDYLISAFHELSIAVLRVETRGSPAGFRFEACTCCTWTSRVCSSRTVQNIQTQHTHMGGLELIHRKVIIMEHTHLSEFRSAPLPLQGCKYPCPPRWLFLFALVAPHCKDLRLYTLRNSFVPNPSLLAHSEMSGHCL